jgi:hypothetical protein
MVESIGFKSLDEDHKMKLKGLTFIEIIRIYKLFTNGFYYEIFET